MCKRFCKIFSVSFPRLLEQHFSGTSAQLPVELSENMLQNLFHNLPPQTVLTVHVMNAHSLHCMATHRYVCVDHMLLPLVVDEFASQLVHRRRHDLQPGVGRRERPLQLLDLRLEHREARHPAFLRLFSFSLNFPGTDHCGRTRKKWGRWDFRFQPRGPFMATEIDEFLYESNLIETREDGSFSF